MKIHPFLLFMSEDPGYQLNERVKTLQLQKFYFYRRLLLINKYHKL
jgi:hypothetical protein